MLTGLFALVAAPLTGTIGKAKTVDDIAVSWCGNSDHDGQQNPIVESNAYNSHVYVSRRISTAIEISQVSEMLKKSLTLRHGSRKSDL